MGNAIQVNGQTYQVRGKLGSGGFSEVYLVHGKLSRHVHLPSEKTVLDRSAAYAVKVIECHDDEQLQRAWMEVQLHRRLQHANIVPLLESEIRVKSIGQDHAKTTKEVLLVFPVYPSGSLQQILNSAKHMPVFEESACLHIFLGIARGVQEIHRLGFIHRDIKPANVLLNDGFSPAVMDLGSIAPLYIPIDTAREASVMVEDAARYSSAAYRAPELWDESFRGILSGKTDVWSLGCTLYAMAYGPFGPFESSKEGVKKLAILNGNVTFPANAGFSVAFVALIQSMLRVNLNDRPALDDVIKSVQQLLQDRATDYDDDPIPGRCRGFPKADQVQSPTRTNETPHDRDFLVHQGRTILSSVLSM
ncbi:hypothetical protein AC1031_002100 [Aphanomyces cochlioides]|nr:hypothetical protein AC1031_002100 [Aphanomyces cochlioides]